jgi:integrase
MPTKKKMSGGRMSRFYYMDFKVNGIRVNRSTKCTDLQEATWVEDSAREELEFGVQPDTMSLSAALKFTSENKWDHNRKSERPVQQVNRCIQLLNDPMMADLMDQPGDRSTGSGKFRLLRVLLKDEGLGESTIDQYMVSMKTVMNTVKLDLPMPNLQLPRIPMVNQNRIRDRVLSAAEETELFNLLDDGHPDWSDFYKVLLYTGFRRSECLGLSFQRNIDFQTNRITLYKDQVKGTNQGAKGRTIVMSGKVREILLRRSRRFPFTVWPVTFTPTAASKMFKKYRIKMGLAAARDFVPHMFRHTCCTRLLENGVEFSVVQAWMGHSTAEMTMRYSHHSVERLDVAAAALDKIDQGIHG